MIGICGKEKENNGVNLSKLGGNCNATSKKPNEEAGRVVQWVKRLPRKREDLSSDSQEVK